MNAGELYRAGRLQDAIDAQVQEVRAHPADPNLRLFLFTLLAFAGDWDRARKQIDAISYGEVAVDATVQNYGMVLNAEQQRSKLFAEGTPPRLLGTAAPHVQLRLDAVTALREGRTTDAARLVNDANSQLPALTGLLNDKPFTALRDADDLFAGVLEVLSQGNYVWIPLEEIASLAMNAPKAPRDLLWIPARIEHKSGAAGEVFLPALYPASHLHADEAIKLGQVTDWREEEGMLRGQGQRLYQVGDGDVAILEWRQLLFT